HVARVGAVEADIREPEAHGAIAGEAQVLERPLQAEEIDLGPALRFGQQEASLADADLGLDRGGAAEEAREAQRPLDGSGRDLRPLRGGGGGRPRRPPQMTRRYSPSGKVQTRSPQ